MQKSQTFSLHDWTNHRPHQYPVSYNRFHHERLLQKKINYHKIVVHLRPDSVNFVELHCCTEVDDDPRPTFPLSDRYRVTSVDPISSSTGFEAGE
jgi:hypothetical protein